MGTSKLRVIKDYEKIDKEIGMISSEPLFVNPIEIMETDHFDETNGEFLVADFLDM